MGIPANELFPGFKVSPINLRLYVKPREFDVLIARLRFPGEELTPHEPGDHGFRLCPVCLGDGVSGWDAKDREILCPHCDGGVIM